MMQWRQLVGSNNNNDIEPRVVHHTLTITTNRFPFKSRIKRVGSSFEKLVESFGNWVGSVGNWVGLVGWESGGGIVWK